MDPRTSKHRLVACAKCRAPVEASGWSGTLVLRCTHCSHETMREMTLDRPSAERKEVAYRQSARHDTGDAPLVIDLEAAPPGRSASKLDDGVLYAALATDSEWDRVWVAVWLAFRYASLNMPLNARVTLETTLETVHTPAYRALLLAKLAQHAAALGARVLAKKWLKARPAVAMAEIDSEVRAARALMAYSKERYGDVVDLTGDRTAGAGFQGNSVLLAIALNVEANAQSGRRRVAEDIVRDCARKGLLPAVLVTMNAFRIGTAVVTRMFRRLRLRSAAISAAIAVAIFAYAAIGLHYPSERTLVAGAVAAIWSGALSWWWMGRPTGSSRPAVARRKLAQWGSAALAVLVPMFWLTRVAPAPNVTPAPVDSSGSNDISPSGWSPDP